MTNPTPDPTPLRLVEDTTFQYAGYARVTWADLAEGDAFRVDAAPHACHTVLGAEALAGLVSVQSVPRSVFVEEILASQGLSPTSSEGAEVDTWVRNAGDPVWMRL